MKSQLLTFAALCAASPFLFAQNDKPTPPAAAADAMPDPKTKEHEALAMFVGDWTTTCKAAPMPGVPGMEKGGESTGPEHTELICNGLWLKSTLTSTWNGKSFEGVWLQGYDPFQKAYKGYWVSNEDETVSPATGSWDAKTKTWTFTGTSPMGETRNVFAWSDADHSVETCFLKGADGKETQCMQITRVRTKGAAPVAGDASATKPEKPSPELALLAQGNGRWDAIVKMATPDGSAMESKANEVVSSICGGKWQWSDFRGSMMGMPFEGHSVTGYDTKTKQYVNLWIDSMSAVAMQTTGSWDGKAKAFTFDGNCVDEQGKPATVHEVMTQPDDATRTLQMTFKTTSRTENMTIEYKRAGK